MHSYHQHQQKGTLFQLAQEIYRKIYNIRATFPIENSLSRNSFWFLGVSCHTWIAACKTLLQKCEAIFKLFFFANVLNLSKNDT